MYAYREEGKRATCVVLARRSATSGGGGGTCEQRLPLDASGSDSEHGRFVYGIAAPEIVRVRVEHQDGLTESFDAQGTEGFTEHFYAGEVGPTPLRRIVGLDSNGKVLAAKNVEHFNISP